MTVGEVSSLSMPLSRRLLCGAYSAIALAAFLLTWRNGGPHDVAGVLDFWRDAKANNSTRFIAVDVLMFGLAAAIWMVVEARKWSIRFVWGYPVAASGHRDPGAVHLGRPVMRQSESRFPVLLSSGTSPAILPITRPGQA